MAAHTKHTMKVVARAYGKVQRLPFVGLIGVSVRHESRDGLHIQEGSVEVCSRGRV